MPTKGATWQAAARMRSSLEGSGRIPGMRSVWAPEMSVSEHLVNGVVEVSSNNLDYSRDQVEYSRFRCPRGFDGQVDPTAGGKYQFECFATAWALHLSLPLSAGPARAKAP